LRAVSIDGAWSSKPDTRTTGRPGPSPSPRRRARNRCRPQCRPGGGWLRPRPARAARWWAGGLDSRRGRTTRSRKTGRDGGPPSRGHRRAEGGGDLVLVEEPSPDVRGRGRYPGPRQPALGMGRRMPLGVVSACSRSCRITPKTWACPPYGIWPRRVPGLRREELAALARVNVDYCVRPEQGRPSNSPKRSAPAQIRVVPACERTAGA
jgi:hypothetical protein